MAPERWAFGVFLFSLALSVPLAAQRDRTVRLRYLSRVDGGLGFRIELPDGEAVSCHIEVTPTRSRLIAHAVVPSDVGARVVAVGSPEERQVLDALERWVDDTFTLEEQAEYLAIPKLPTPRTQDEDHWSRRVELLRQLRLYEEVSRPEIAKVFAGRGTVSLSLQLTLGPSEPQVLLWRRFDEDEFARLYVAPKTEPVVIDSKQESALLLGMANWLAARLGEEGRATLWEGEHEKAEEDVRLVLRAYRGYLDATSPRLRSSGVVMDRAGGGTRRFEITDARNGTTVVRFDFAAATATPGRLYEGETLVELGSEREAELLAMMRRAAELRRRWCGAAAEEDPSLSSLEEQIEGYVGRFRDAK